MRKQSLIVSCACALIFIFAAQTLAAAEELTVRGRLTRTVEAGGWLIAAEREKYLILNPQRFQSETWFRAGTDVEASGETKPGTITIYQEGVPFEVRTMRPLRGDGATAGGTTGAGVGGTRVVVSGDSLVEAQPDTAILMIAVVTQNRNASEAQAENASKTEAVVRAVKASAGAGAEVKTSGYSLQPQYVYKENQPPLISGYTARNSVVVTMGELNRVGTVIDAASQAGANSVDNLSFTLRRDRPAREQALSEATREALAKAQTIAQALGGRVVRILEVQEAGTVRPLPVMQRMDAEFGRAASMAAPATPIEVGSLNITSQVQLVAEIETQR